ncbi:MAG: transposase, partial [Bacteroidota bacterium]|nr:transposase [Bacteroidota bacterium]
MTKYKNKYRIEPNRWQFWDYSAPGRYFLTVCIRDMECILGNVVNKKMVLSEFGKIVETEI